jgi:hypothetical protein
MTDFPTAMDSTLPKGASDYSRENVIGWYKGSEIATITFSQGRYISMVKKLAEKYPDDVKVLNNADGTILAYVPVKAIHISLRKNTEMSDEQKKAASERFKKMHAARKKKSEENK